MNKDIFIFENELNNLGDEFKNLKSTELEENKKNMNENNMSSGLSVSRDNTNQDILKKLKDYVIEKNPTLAILTPCYGGLCHSSYTICLINTIEIFHSVGFRVNVHFLNNDSLVSRARNNLIGSTMLDKSITHFMFIDGDIVWNPIDIIKLVLADEMIIGGLYPKKAYKFNKIISNPTVINNWIEKKNKIDPNISNETIVRNNLLDYNLNYLSPHLEINNNIIEIKHLATGFMMIKREAIELMISKYPETKYIDDTGFIPKEKSTYTYALFDCGVINGSYYSEDWLFCHRWTEIGGKIYANISIDLIHIGVENYEGSFIKNLLTTK